MNLSEKLIFLRKQKGLTQLELAEKLNISRQAISRWEVGSAVPNIDNLKIICNLYDVPVDYLLNDDLIESSGDSLDIGKEHEQKNQDPKTMPRQRKVLTCILIVVITVLLIICTAKTHERKQEQITPIKEMEHIVEDEYATVTFPLK